MALCARKKLVLSKLGSNLTLREVEEAPIEGEVLHVDVVEEVGEVEEVEEEEEEEEEGEEEEEALTAWGSKSQGWCNKNTLLRNRKREREKRERERERE